MDFKIYYLQSRHLSIIILYCAYFEYEKIINQFVKKMHVKLFLDDSIIIPMGNSFSKKRELYYMHELYGIRFFISKPCDTI